ncbi:hypothetical protein [Phormidium nigroviride]
MNLPRYEDHEKDFLEAMATRFGFSGNTELAFVQRLLLSNKDLDQWERLAEVLNDDLLRGARNEEADPVTLLKNRWDKAICPTLEKELKCTFSGKGKWKQVKKQLCEVEFPKWAKERGLIAETLLNFEQMWENLKTKATRTNKMGVVLAPQLTTSGLTHPEPSDYLESVPINSDILFKANLDCQGHLILLEREPSGAVCCVCPSKYAPDSRYTLNQMTLPQFPPSPHPAFTATELGKEQLLALITQDLPPLAWLGESKQKVVKLDRPHLQELLDYLDGVSQSQVFYTEYRVMAS